MDDLSVNFIGNVRDYVVSAEDKLEKQARLINNLQKERQEFMEKISTTVDLLAEHGHIPKHFISAVKEDFQKEPVKLAEFVSGINTTTRQSIGEADSSNINHRSSGDPVLQWLFSDSVQ